MSYQNIGKLIDQWMNDMNFRNEFRKDFNGTIRKSGFQLTQEELAIIQKVDWNKSDQELQAMISKVA